MIVCRFEWFDVINFGQEFSSFGLNFIKLGNASWAVFFQMWIKGCRPAAFQLVTIFNHHHINIFVSTMSVLSQKLQQAYKLFQSHNYAQSLEAYEDSIKFCHRTHQDQSVILNIMSTKAAVQSVLGQHDNALATLNSVLTKDSSHFLSLMRRSQVYKFKNKLKKAMKDIQQILVFCPGFEQISALKTEIEQLLSKEGNIDELSSESDQQLEQAQELSLKFMNLKNIDRKSNQISVHSERKSRVTILGDHTFEYKREQIDEIVEEDLEDYFQKATRTYKEIESDGFIEVQPVFKVVSQVKAKKSILKNKGTSIFIQSENYQQKQAKYLGRESKLISMIKNIDGKVIVSAEHPIQITIKQVEFRKSVSKVPLEQLLAPVQQTAEQNQIQDNSPKILNNGNLLKRQSRKSCLKRSSFEVQPVVVKRKSKFEEMDKLKIDGKVLTHSKRKSIDQKQVGRENGEESHSDNEGSQHNIFGSNQIYVSHDLKMRLGLLQPEPQPKIEQAKPSKLKPKHSILKKNSSVIVQKKISLKKTSEFASLNLRSKKSVMFNCTL